MKCRNGFVSNSSSSSYIIKKQGLTEDQLEKIRNHVDYYELLDGYQDCDWLQHKSDEWTIEETEEEIRCHTIIDNFDMANLLWAIGVPYENITEEWDSNSSLNTWYKYKGNVPLEIRKQNVIDYITNTEFFKKYSKEEQEEFIKKFQSDIIEDSKE